MTILLAELSDNEIEAFFDEFIQLAIPSCTTRAARDTGRPAGACSVPSAIDHANDSMYAQYPNFRSAES